jgi:hypothetical protein
MSKSVDTQHNDTLYNAIKRTDSQHKGPICGAKYSVK